MLSYQEFAKLNLVDFHGKKCLKAFVSKGEKTQILDKEKTVTGPNLRGPCLSEVEYVFPHPPGQPLDQYIRQNQIDNRSFEFDTQERAAILRQLVTGVSGLHSKGLLARCISLENVYYHGGRGGTGTITLTAFGSYPRLLHCPPEYLQPKQAYNQKSDIWLLGVIMLQLETLIIYQKIQSYQECIDLTNKKVTKLTSDMLRLSPEERVSLDEVLNRLQDEEVDLVPFDQPLPVQVPTFTSSITTWKKTQNEPQKAQNDVQREIFSNTFYERVAVLLSEVTNQQLNVIVSELKFYFYRLEILSQISNIIQDCTGYIEQISIYFIQKLRIYYLQEAKKDVTGQAPFFCLSPEEWQRFTSSCRNLIEQLNLVISKELGSSVKKFGLCYTSVMSSQLEDDEERKLHEFMEKGKHLRNDSYVGTFEEIKIPYRKSLNSLLRFIECTMSQTRNVQDLSKLKLLVQISLSINQAFQKPARQRAFSVIAQPRGQLTDPKEIQTFQEEAIVGELENQTKVLRELFFPQS